MDEYQMKLSIPYYISYITIQAIQDKLVLLMLQVLILR